MPKEQKQTQPDKRWVQTSGGVEFIEECLAAGHAVKVSFYGTPEDMVEINIDCEDCWSLLMGWEKC